MKRQSTIVKEQMVVTLRNLDSKYRFKNTSWNEAVKTAFHNSGSFDFINLVHTSPNVAQALITKFK